MTVWDSLNLNAPHTERELSGNDNPPPDNMKGVWHVRHEDEIWCGTNHWICNCVSEAMAVYIVTLHNNTLRKVQ